MDDNVTGTGVGPGKGSGKKIGESNIEKWMRSTGAQELHSKRRAGAYASHAVQAAKRAARQDLNDRLDYLLKNTSVTDMMQHMLIHDLTPEQRMVVRSIVPDSIPDEQITPIVAMFYRTIDGIIRSGDAAALEKILRIAGQTAELKVKLEVQQTDAMTSDLSQLSDEELISRKLKLSDPIDVDYTVIDDDSAR